jgi:gas vesicle protein
MADNRSGASGAFVVGVLLGGAIGAVSGLLLAPRSGRETRQILKKSADALPELAEDLSSSVQIQADRLSGSALRNWDSTLGRLKEAIAAGLEASQRSAQETARPATPEVGVRPVAKTHTSTSDAS